MARYTTTFFAALFVALVALAGCSDDTANPAQKCKSDELYDQVNDECVPRGSLTPGDAGDTSADGQSADVGDDAAEPDAGADTGDTTDSSDAADAADADTDAVDMSQCDKDHDGALAESCGGYDCDDNDPARSPNYTEFCDQVDNDCSGVVNDTITCSFYAHSGEDLYEVDPFAKTATRLGSGLPNLLDIDTHPDGTLFGITYDGLYRLDTWAGQWVKQGDFGIDVGDPNGLAIDSTGTAFITSEDKIYSADLHTGQARLVGTTGNFYSSGDCVVNKRDTLFMTSKNQDQNEDTLVQVSRQDGHGTAVGGVGFKSVYALTAAWGTLYGLTSDGELIKINQQTGEGTLVHQFPNIRFYGAASTPNR